MKTTEDVVLKLIEKAKEREALDTMITQPRINRLSGYIDALTWVLG